MTKTRISKARVKVTIHWYLQGSVLKGTVESGCKEVKTDLQVESDDDIEKVRHVVRCAKRGCFAEQMIVRPTPLTSTISVNGAAFEL
jgi:hypothetical protein